MEEVIMPVDTVQTGTNQDKVAEPGDLFEAIPAPSGQINASLGELGRRIGQPKRRTFTRSELVLADLNVARLVRSRWLKPLQESSPEMPGLTIPEILDRYLPDPARPVEMLQAAFALVDAPQQALPDALRLANDEPEGGRWIVPVAERLQPAITAACLLPLLEALEHENSGQGRGNSNVSRLAYRLLSRTAPERFKGLEAMVAVDRLLDLLEMPGNIAIAPTLLAILTAIDPPPSLRLYSSIRRLETAEEKETKEAAEEAFYTAFIAPA
jgi:hypothetical protein